MRRSILVALAAIAFIGAGFGLEATASAQSVALGELAEGQGAAWGDWSVWRASDRHVLFVHKDGGVAVEINTNSNGYFKFAATGKEYIVWSTGSHDEQALGVTLADWAKKRRPTRTLTVPRTPLSSWTFKMKGSDIVTQCSADGETVVISPNSASFKYITFKGKEITFPTGGAAAAGAVVAPPTAAASEYGETFGEWTLWHRPDGHIIIVHTKGKTVIDLNTGSNGWFMLYAGDAEWTVWSTGEQSGGSASSKFSEYYGRKASAKAKKGTKSFEHWKMTASKKKIEFVCDADGETIILKKKGPGFTYKTHRGKLVSMPRADAKPAKGAVPTEPAAVVSAGAEGLAAVSVGTMLSWGQWHIWRASEKEVVFHHPKDDVWIEFVLTSNGWLHYRAKKKTHIIWSTGEQSDASTNTTLASKPRTPTGVASEARAAIKEWTFRFSGDVIKASCSADGETVVIHRNRSAFEYVTHLGKTIDFPK